MFHKTTLVISLIVSLLSACGSQDRNSQVFSAKDSTKIKDVVVHLSGGFRSCETANFRESFDWLASKMREADLGVRLVYSCYDQLGYLYYQSPYMTEKRFTKTMENVFAAVETQLGDSESKYFVAIGHSWGGWLAMETSEFLKETYQTQALATIDVISPKHCGFGSMAKTFIQRASTLGSGEPGCLGSPKDWPNDRSSQLIPSEASFQNFYQTRDDVLHSGAIGGAVNQVLSYGSEFKGWGVAHRAIDNDQRVWDAIGAALFTQISN